MASPMRNRPLHLPIRSLRSNLVPLPKRPSSSTSAIPSTSLLQAEDAIRQAADNASLLASKIAEGKKMTTHFVADYDHNARRPHKLRSSRRKRDSSNLRRTDESITSGHTRSTGSSSRSNGSCPLPKFENGHEVFYCSNGRSCLAKIINTHLNNRSQPYYTIRLPDGREKHTEEYCLAMPGGAVGKSIRSYSPSPERSSPSRQEFEQKRYQQQQKLPKKKLSDRARRRRSRSNPGSRSVKAQSSRRSHSIEAPFATIQETEQSESDNIYKICTRSDDYTSNIDLILDPGTGEGTFHHPDLPDLSFKVDKNGVGTFSLPQSPSLLFCLTLEIDTSDNDNDTIADSSRYFLQCSMGELSKIRKKNRKTNVLKTISQFNDFQKSRIIRKADGTREISKRIKCGLLSIDSSSFGFKRGFNSSFKEKKRCEVVMTMTDKLYLGNDWGSDVLRHWKLDSEFRKNLERFVMDGVRFYSFLC